jgi:hypothetical protein
MNDESWRSSIEVLIEQAHEKAEQYAGDQESLASLIADIHDIKVRLADAWEYASSLLIEVMGENPEVVSGNKMIEKKVGAPRKSWRHNELADEVAKRIMASSIDMDTGEVMKSTEQMMLEMLSYGAVSYWRVKNLSKIGLVADEYCDVGEPKTSLVVRNMGVAFSQEEQSPEE